MKWALTYAPPQAPCWRKRATWRLCSPTLNLMMCCLSMRSTACLRSWRRCCIRRWKTISWILWLVKVRPRGRLKSICRRLPWLAPPPARDPWPRRYAIASVSYSVWSFTRFLISSTSWAAAPAIWGWRWAMKARWKWRVAHAVRRVLPTVCWGAYAIMRRWSTMALSPQRLPRRRWICWTLTRKALTIWTASCCWRWLISSLAGQSG